MPMTERSWRISRLARSWTRLHSTMDSCLRAASDLRRLFVGCRNGKLVIMNADDGKIVADFPIGAFVDATAFDNGLLFASCFRSAKAICRLPERQTGDHECR